MIVLEPTVELEPWDWVGEKAHKIIGTSEWNSYWDGFLETIGIKPTYSGSWFISVEQINQPSNIKKILNLPDDLSINNIDDCLMPLLGGYMLFENNNILFEPQCCCDLGDINSFKELIDLKSENWYNLLMGHGLMSARRIENIIEIKEVPEYAGREPIIEQFEYKELHKAILEAEQKINVFREKIEVIINEIFNDTELSNKIARRLSGQL